MIFILNFEFALFKKGGFKKKKKKINKFKFNN